MYKRQETTDTTTSSGSGAREDTEMITNNGFHSPLQNVRTEGSRTQLSAENTTTILLGRCINENIITVGERDIVTGATVTTARERETEFSAAATAARSSNSSGGGGGSSLRDGQNGGRTLQKQWSESDRPQPREAHTATVSAMTVDSTTTSFAGGGGGDPWSPLPQNGAIEIGNVGWSRMTIAMPSDHDGALHGERSSGSIA